MAPFSSAVLGAYPVVFLAFKNHSNRSYHALTTMSLLIPFNDEPVLPSEGKGEAAESLLPSLGELFCVLSKYLLMVDN